MSKSYSGDGKHGAEKYLHIRNLQLQLFYFICHVIYTIKKSEVSFLSIYESLQQNNKMPLKNIIRGILQHGE